MIGRLEERWVQQGKPRLACRSFLPQPGEKECFKLKTMELLSWGFAGLSGPRSGTILLTESAHNGFKLDLSGIFQGTRSCTWRRQRVEPYTKVYSMQVPLRAIYRAITKSNRAIYRTITGIIFTKSDHKNRKYMGFTITKWTNGQNLGRYVTKITKTGNIEVPTPNLLFYELCKI